MCWETQSAQTSPNPMPLAWRTSLCVLVASMPQSRHLPKNRQHTGRNTNSIRSAAPGNGTRCLLCVVLLIELRVLQALRQPTRKDVPEIIRKGILPGGGMFFQWTPIDG